MANGLQTCSDAQFDDDTGSGCPNASKIGLAEVTSPLLPDPLTGSVYLGAPTASEKYRVLVKLKSDGVVIDLDGQAIANETTGQVTARFASLPQLPLSELQLHFFGGPSAAFANPTACGAATSTSSIASYSGQTAAPSSTFNTTAATGESTCPSSLPFAPGFVAGTSSSLAAGFSPFTVTVTRADGQQLLSSLTTQLPPGLLAMFPQVPACSDAQASSGGCPAASQIGSAVLGAGAGPQPLYIPGQVYLTGPYKQGIAGLAIVVPTAGGPFDLGTIVVRAQILVNPSNLQMTIISDPLPQILDGIPLRLRAFSLTIDRSDFVFNPSNCSPQTITGTINSVEGAGAAVSTPFQAAGCSGLAFSPKVSVSTQAAASALGNGASLNLRVSRAAGTQANISSVVMELPIRLRPRLTTAQQACMAKAFAANPASCPSASHVGSVNLSTPVLPSALTGDVYLVYRGGGSFPEFRTKLRGPGIAMELHGTIDISRSNAVSMAFKGLPDVPIGSFQLKLPRGPHSALGAIAPLCPKQLQMHYEISADNGVKVKHALPILVSGCPKTFARHARTAKKRT
jgi:hypothetical protein